MESVSIIIPAYNYAGFLPFAVRSCLAQTWENLEVLIVDDGSTDETPAVAQGFTDERVRYLRKENQGLSAARNTGIERAQGELLVFLDADDVLKPEMVEESVKVLRSHGGEFGLIAHLPDRIDAEGAPLSPPWPPSEGDMEVGLVDLLVKNRFPPTILVRKELFEKAGLFDTSLKASEDRDMWIRLARHCRILRLRKALSQSRKHGSNMSSHGTRQAACIQTVHRKARAAGDLRGSRRILWLKVHSFFLYQRAMMLGHVTPGKALRDLAGSILLWPVHLDRESLEVRPLFRLRMAFWILRGCP